jgi:hypothetical protein
MAAMGGYYYCVHAQGGGQRKSGLAASSGTRLRGAGHACREERASSHEACRAKPEQGHRAVLAVLNYQF